MNAGPVRVGLVGAGNISDQYLDSLARYPDVHVAAVADVVPGRAAAQVDRFSSLYGHDIASGGIEVVLDDPTIEVVVNLTNPVHHAGVDRQALMAGKHVWTEKPLTTDVDSAREVLDLARDHGLLVGCAPDSVLGPSVQESLRVVRESVGRPMTGLSVSQTPGPDDWHPNVVPFYGPGGGPVLDIGPYSVTALVLGLGPVVGVMAGGGRARETRTVLVGERTGEQFPVEVPTTAQALLQHEGGASSVLLMSFDNHGYRWDFEMAGSDARIVCADPTQFGGIITTIRNGHDEAVLEVDDAGCGRGLGVVDLARSVRAVQGGGSPTHVCTGDLGLHVLEVLLAVNTAIDTGARVPVTTHPGVLGSSRTGFTARDATL